MSARGPAPAFFNQTPIASNPVSAKLVAKATHQMSSIAGAPPQNLISTASAMQVQSVLGYSLLCKFVVKM